MIAERTINFYKCKLCGKIEQEKVFGFTESMHKCEDGSEGFLDYIGYKKINIYEAIREYWSNNSEKFKDMNENEIYEWLSENVDTQDYEFLKRLSHSIFSTLVEKYVITKVRMTID